MKAISYHRWVTYLFSTVAACINLRELQLKLEC